VRRDGISGEGFGSGPDYDVSQFGLRKSGGSVDIVKDEMGRVGFSF
jgi:hypothetical protein